MDRFNGRMDCMNDIALWLDSVDNYIIYLKERWNIGNVE